MIFYIRCSRKILRWQFRPATYGGFDVLDLDVFDIALRKLEQKVKTHISTAQVEEIVLIEFSRNDYGKLSSNS